MIQQFKFDYDQENDSLFMYKPDSRTKASVEIGDFIIDYNSNKEIVALELLHASAFFQDISPSTSIDKEKLKTISDCRIDIKTKNNFFVITFMFKLSTNEELTAPVIIPTVKEPSPASIA